VDSFRGRPNDKRGFIHRKILGILPGILPIPGVGIIKDVITGIVGGGGPPPVSVGSQGFWQNKATGATSNQPGPPAPKPRAGLDRDWEWVTSAAVTPFAPNGGNGVLGPCQPPLMRDPLGNCTFPLSPSGATQFGGNAIMGRFGAGVVPGSAIRDIAVCPSGMALGKDRICYDHLPNRDRLYPRGRRPLLTGGEMRCISRASSAAKKLDRTNARLRGLGLMKPEAVRKRRPKKVC